MVAVESVFFYSFGGLRFRLYAVPICSSTQHIGIRFIDDSLELLSVYELLHYFTSSLSKELVDIHI